MNITFAKDFRNFRGVWSLNHPVSSWFLLNEKIWRSVGDFEFLIRV